MPTIEYRSHSLAGVQADALAVFAARDGDGAVTVDDEVRALVEAADIALDQVLETLGFTATADAVARVPTLGHAQAGLLLVVGLGETPDVDALRRAAMVVARNAPKDADLAVVVPAGLLHAGVDTASRAAAVAEGIGLGAYAYVEHRRKHPDTPSIGTAAVVAPSELRGADVRAGVQTGVELAAAANFTRDLVNTPPGHKRPADLAERIVEAMSGTGVKTRVLDERDLASGGFGGILGVGQGSAGAPRLVELTYAPRGAERSIVLVGKGITFDSGGLSLKPSGSMATMKSDMAGAAAIAGAMRSLRALGVNVRVRALLALAENMPSGTAIRVSDVLEHRGGTTVEVMNTDAEGRLVMADALAYGSESEPDAIVDVATLTGAQVVALGERIAALMGSDDGLVEELRGAAVAAGERVWPLPLPEDYRELLSSEVADLRNVASKRGAGTIVAGLFLSTFVEDGIPWAHLDIAGPAFAEGGDGPWAKGATGFATRLLLRWLVSAD